MINDIQRAYGFLPVQGIAGFGTESRQEYLHPATMSQVPYARLLEQDKRDIARMVVELLRAEATGPGTP